jgi:hypothetical protein
MFSPEWGGRKKVRKGILLDYSYESNGRLEVSRFPQCSAQGGAYLEPNKSVEVALALLSGSGRVMVGGKFVHQNARGVVHPAWMGSDHTLYPGEPVRRFKPCSLQKVQFLNSEATDIVCNADMSIQ